MYSRQDPVHQTLPSLFIVQLLLVNLLVNYCSVEWSTVKYHRRLSLFFAIPCAVTWQQETFRNEMLLNRNLITLVPSATVERRTYCLTARSQTSVETTTDSCSSASRYKVSHDRWFCHHWPAIHFIVLMVQSKFAGARLVQNEAELGVCL